MVRPAAATLLALGLALSLPAGGADLTLSASGEVEYDDNVFNRGEGEEDDILFRLRPGVRIHEDRGQDLDFSLEYRPSFELALENSEELNDVDHFANGSFTYRASDRMEITGSERFSYLRGILRERVETQVTAAGAGVPVVTEERDRVTRNDASLGVSYNFSPRWAGNVRAAHSFFDSSREDRSTVNTVRGTADLLYALGPRHRIGGGVRLTYQDFEETDVFAGSESTSYGLIARWEFTFDETTAFEISAGPTFIETVREDAPAVSVRRQVPFQDTGLGVFLVSDPNACRSVLGRNVLPCDLRGAPIPADDGIRNAETVVENENPRGERASRMNLFVNALLTKSWTPALRSALRYSRREGNASGLGGTVITDALSFSTSWDLNERWSASLRGDWTRRESISDQVGTFFEVCPTDPDTLTCVSPGDPGAIAGLNGQAFNAEVDTVRIDTRRWGVSGRLGYRLFRNTRLHLRVTYDEQESRGGTRGSTSDFENFLATLGIRHEFEPMKLW